MREGQGRGYGMYFRAERGKGGEGMRQEGQV